MACRLQSRYTPHLHNQVTGSAGRRNRTFVYRPSFSCRTVDRSALVESSVSTRCAKCANSARSSSTPRCRLLSKDSPLVTQQTQIKRKKAYEVANTEHRDRWVCTAGASREPSAPVRPPALRCPQWPSSQLLDTNANDAFVSSAAEYLSAVAPAPIRSRSIRWSRRRPANTRHQ